MYSNKKYYNKYPKRYRKYRYNIKDIYSPSLYKAPSPNYYQQKGRVLQQSPRLMFNSPTEIMSKTKLDKLYKTLVRYKYQFPKQPLPSDFTIPPFMITINQSMEELFPLEEDVRNYTFGADEFFKLSLNTLDVLYPQFAESYSWQFKLLYIQFNIDTDQSFDYNLQYSIVWHSDLIYDNELSIFAKSYNHSIEPPLSVPLIQNKFNGSIIGNEVYFYYQRVNVNSNGVASLLSTAIQSMLSEVPIYESLPYIDTGSLLDLPDGQLEFVAGSGMREGDVSQYINAKLYILCIPLQSD